jgi:uncharacterized protein (TIGR03086 family)
VEPLVEHHRRACDEFLRVARAVPDDRWSAPTPCTEWDAQAVVEHVIGFHDFLLLRPLGVRAHRPREGAAARWEATENALFDALAQDGALDRELEMLSGEMSSPRRMLPALTTEMLVHTWDLGIATGVALHAEPDRTRLIGAWGRDPMWTPPHRQ